MSFNKARAVQTRLFHRLAAAMRTRIGQRNSNVRFLVSAIVAVAPSALHRRVALDLIRAISSSEFARAHEIASTAMRKPDRRAEKIISRKYRYLWICNPKVASRSIILALRKVDPAAELILDSTVDEIYAAHDEASDYYSFAFIRNPYDRAYSFYAEKHLATSDLKRILFVEPYYGVSEGCSFDEICQWLNTPYGSDAFADRHWLSQERHLRLRTGGMPDFIGRYENINDDLNAVATTLGMPKLDLPWLNAAVGPDATLESIKNYHSRRDVDLSLQCKSLLYQRYAGDFELGGYAA